MHEIRQLLAIMRALRDPQNGCPWDLDQDFASIAPYTVEEAYEVADAIERNDLDELKHELGDLLFQVVFHSQLASEVGAFDFDEVVQAICDKLIRRHPHVFAGQDAADRAELAQQWEQHKRREREQKAGDGSSLDGIATALPALRWSQKLQRRAAGTGFDWPDIAPVFEKLEEELQELKAEIGQPDNRERITDEYGDVLFVCVNLAKHLDIDAEQALRQANRKFIARFELMESLIREQGASMQSLPLAQMEAFWRQAKRMLADRAPDD